MRSKRNDGRRSFTSMYPVGKFGYALEKNSHDNENEHKKIVMTSAKMSSEDRRGGAERQRSSGRGAKERSKGNDRGAVQRVRRNPANHSPGINKKSTWWKNIFPIRWPWFKWLLRKK